jgi:protein SCO1/2
MTTNMTTLQEKYKNDEDILLLSYSVTPTMDSMSVLKNYAEV